MKIIIYISRIIVGSLFVVSGLIKANDPLGFSYKLGEYFEESALNLTFLEPLALTLAIIVCIAEIVLGFAVLFGGKMKLASWSLLLLTVFFGWLTLYTATCDPQATYTAIEDGKEVEKTVKCVTDCGCFGDAMKGSVGRSLTPWESFYKDLILFILIIPVFLKRKDISLNTNSQDIIIFTSSLIAVSFFSWVFTWYFPVLFFFSSYGAYFIIKKLTPEKIKEWSIAGTVTLFSLVFALYCYSNLPIRDYRPYAIGKSITEQMAIPEGAPQNVYDVKLIYKNSGTGETKELSQDEYMKNWELYSEENGWAHVETKSTLIKKGYKPPIHDFKISDYESNDYTQDFLNDPEYIFIWISYDLTKTNKKAHEKFNAFADQCFKNGISVIGLTASDYNTTEDFRHEIQVGIDYYQADQITLKTIIRSNPGLVLLKKGTVINNWHYNNLPEFDEALPQ